MLPISICKLDCLVKCNANTKLQEYTTCIYMSVLVLNVLNSDNWYTCSAYFNKYEEFDSSHVICTNVHVYTGTFFTLHGHVYFIL